jgi:hypothetical protein
MKGRIPKFIGVLAALMLAISFSLVPMVATPEPVAAGDLRFSEAEIPEQGDEGDWVLANGSEITAIAISPDFAADETIYIGAVDLDEDGDGDVDIDDIILKSDDAGETWEIQEDTQDEGPFIGIAMSPDYGSDEIVFAITIDEIWRTDDDGDTWDLFGDVADLGAASTEIRSLDVDRSIEGTTAIVVATEDDVFLYGEGEGVLAAWDWAELDVDTEVADFDEVIEAAFSPNYEEEEDGLIVAVVSTQDAVTLDYNVAVATYIIDDDDGTPGDGDGWDETLGAIELLDDDSATSVNRAAIAFASDYAWDDESWIFVGIEGTDDDDVFRVEGDDTSDVEYMDLSKSIVSLAIGGDYDDAVILAGEDNGNVHRTNNPQSKDPDWDDAERFKDPTGDEDALVVMAPAFADEGMAYCVTAGDNSAFNRTENGNLTWEQMSMIDTAIDPYTGRGRLQGITDFYITSEDDWYMLTGDTAQNCSFWVTADGGDTWLRLLYMDAAEEIDSIKPVRGTNTYYLSSDTELWKSPDQGITWGRARKFEKTQLAWSPRSDELLEMGDASGNWYRSENSGASWEKLEGTAGTNPYRMRGIRGLDGAYVGGTEDGEVWMTLDNMESFTEIPDQGTSGLPNGERIAVTASPGYSSDKTLYASVGKGDTYPVWRFVVGEDSEWEEITGAEHDVAGTITIREGALYVMDGTPAADDGLGFIKSWDPASERNPEDTFVGELGMTDKGLHEDHTGVGKMKSVSTDDGVFFVGRSGDEDRGSRTYLVTYTDTQSATPPGLTSPVAGEVVGEYVATEDQWKTTLKWEPSAGAEGYHVQVHDAADFEALVVEDDTLTAGQTSWKVRDDDGNPILDGGTQYWWRVRAFDEDTGVGGPWSEASFIIGLNDAGLSTPEDGEREIPVTPTFGWKPVSGANSYRFQLSDDSTFGSTLMDSSMTGTAIKSDKALAWESVYFWRVKAISDVAESDWAVFAFTTRPEILEGPPAPEITMPAINVPAPVVNIPPAAPAPTPAWAWVAIFIFALLLIAVVVLVVRTRRPM